MMGRRFMVGSAFCSLVTVAALICMCWSAGFGRGRCERWVRTEGPEGGEIISIAIDSSEPSIVYAATYGGGVHRSTDGGTNWTSINRGLIDVNIHSLALDPVTPSTLYVGTYWGLVYRSTDRGINWKSANPQLPGGISALAVDPTRPSTLYAAVFGQGVFCSTDSGVRWTAINNGLNKYVSSLAVDPESPSVLYAGGSSAGVYRTTNAGESWTAVTEGLTNLRVNQVAIDPLDSSKVYAATDDVVFRSTNRGMSWTRLGNGVGSWVYVHSFAIDPVTPSTLYAGTWNGVYRSTDNGDNWTAANAQVTESWVRCLAVDPSTPTRIYAGTGEGVYRSIDSGRNWVQSNAHLRVRGFKAVAVDPSTPSILFAGDDWGAIYRSADRGGTWEEISQVSGYTLTLVVHPEIPSILYAGMNGAGVYRSTDAGRTWAPTGLTHSAVNSLAIAPLTPSTLYAANSYSWDEVKAGVFRSTDGGDNWVPLNNGLPDQGALSIAIDPVTPSTLFAGTTGGVFRSTDSGGSWVEVSNGLTNKLVESVVINPKMPSTVYAATWGGGVFRTSDAGGNWAAVNNGMTYRHLYSLLIDPLNPSVVYAMSSLENVFRTTDGGERWNVLDDGLRGTYLHSLAMDPVDTSRLYLATSGGLLRLESDCTLQFSQIGKGLGFTSDVVLTNPSSFRTVTGTILVCDDAGLPLSVGLNPDFAILPQSSLTLSTDGLGDLRVGSAVIGTDGPLDGIVRFRIPGIGIAGVGASEALTGFIAPVRRFRGGITTGLALSNPDIGPVSLDLALRNEQGQEVPGGRRTIEHFPGGGHLAQFIDEFFPDASIEAFHGTLVVQARDGRIAASALELGPEPGQFTALPVTPLPTAGVSADFSFAQFGNGQGFTSDMVLINPSASTPVSGRVNFYSDQGQPMSVRVGGPLGQNSTAFSISPLGLARVISDGGGSLRIGSARVTADGPVGGAVRFSIPGMGIAGVGASASLARFLIPVRRTAEGIRTGIALQNRGEAAVTIALTLKDATGATTATGSIDSLPGRGHVARFLEELFEDLAPEFQGTVCVEVTGGTVAAAALELGRQPGEFTTLPVTPIE